MAACKSKALQPGKLLVVRENTLGGEKIIINFPTKTEWRLKSKYGYVEEGLKELARVIAENNIESIANPPLGCGNGGLKWEKVKPMIAQHNWSGRKRKLFQEKYIHIAVNHLKDYSNSLYIQ